MFNFTIAFRAVRVVFYIKQTPIVKLERFSVGIIQSDFFTRLNFTIWVFLRTGLGRNRKTAIVKLDPSLRLPFACCWYLRLVLRLVSKRTFWTEELQAREFQPRCHYRLLQIHISH